MQPVCWDAKLEQRFRLEVLQAWDSFAQASRESRRGPGNSVYGERARAREFDAFLRYQRALRRFSDLVVYGKTPDVVD